MLIIIWCSCIQGIHAPLRSKVSETHEHSKTFTEQMCNFYLKKTGPRPQREPAKNEMLIIQSDNQGLPLATQQEVDERGHISDVHHSVKVAVTLGSHLGIAQEHIDELSHVGNVH